MSDEQKPEDSPAPAPEIDPQAAGAPQPRALAANARLADLTIGDLNSIIAAETNRAIASRLGNLGNIGAAGSHVNSGPPGFVNGGGHANFDPARGIGNRVNVGDLGRAGSHVNSGPPGFVNGGGHANFDPRVNVGAGLINVTLPDGGQVAIPAAGPVDLHVRGFHITR